MKVNVGISEGHRRTIAEGLSRLLSDTYTLYLKTQNYHWNVTGPAFYSLHALFEKHYEALAAAVDEIAERIRALGFPAPAGYSQFAELSSVKEELGTPKATEMIRQLVSDHEAVIKTARSVFAAVEAGGDEATVDLLIKRIAYHEKAAWMLRSSL